MNRILKAISFLLVTVILTGCGQKLTKENIWDHLYVEANYQKDEIADNHCAGIDGIVTVKALNDHYDYSDIGLVLTVHIETAYTKDINEDDIDHITFSKEVPVDLNVNGDGTSAFRIDFNSYFDAIGDEISASKAKQKPQQYSHYYPIIIDSHCEVTDIKGRLKK